MSTAAPLLLFALSGFLLGGGWSIQRQGRSTVVAGVLVVGGVLALAMGVMAL